MTRGETIVVLREMVEGLRDSRQSMPTHEPWLRLRAQYLREITALRRAIQALETATRTRA